MEQNFLQFVKTHPVVLGDGAMGSMLIDAGMELGDCAEWWNLDRPDTIADIHKRYVDAGSDFILTNTFGANPFRLSQHDLHEQTTEINRTAALLARDAANNTPYILGSIGPSGQIPEPIGNMKSSDLESGFQMQAKALIEGGVDGIIIETMMHIEEALCAFRAVQSIRNNIPVIVSICFQCKNDSYQTASGITPQETAEILTESGVSIIAANCMFSFECYAEIVSQLRRGTTLPIMVQPNAGQPISKNSHVHYPMTPERMMEHIPSIIHNGASIIGGCCGTTPNHTAALRHWINQNYETQ